MPSKLRSGKARVSFFAFQDMITTVTGVLLLITLLLTLYLNAQPDVPAPGETVRDKLTKAQKDLSAQMAQLEQRRLEQMALTNKVFVVAEADRSGKQPVLVVLSATNGLCSKLGSTNTVEFAAGRFGDVLKQWNAGAQRIVFYIRPSAIANFEDCRRLAQAGSFSIGYDAAEEGRQYELTSR
ncbi:MAG TPA: hypothetical protein VH619_04765 [Verrucomicrobiae bacterium]|jgi:hypothetical protein|nr:hypothetical protein [Verrucomicrobiae bacterium]